MNLVQAVEVVNLEPFFEGFSEPVIGIGFDGAVYAAARSAKQALRLLRWFDGEVIKTDLEVEPLAAHFIQPSHAGVMLVAARCAWRASGPERNAVCFDWNGVETGRFTFGDGIESVQTSVDGTSWVSFFDEGVFGNRGWSSPGPEPLGSSGLLAFDQAGQQIFNFDASAAKTDRICDAYAMYVAGRDDVWVYFYTEFPIVRVRRGVYSKWTYGIGGARAMAVRGDRVLLFGDYQQPSLLRQVRLGADGVARVTREFKVSANGTSLDQARAWGVGEALYFASGSRVFTLPCSSIFSG